MVQYIQKSENYFQKIYSNGKKVRVSKSEFLKNEMKGGTKRGRVKKETPKEKKSYSNVAATGTQNNENKKKKEEKIKLLKKLHVNKINNNKIENISKNEITELQKKIRETKKKVVNKLSNELTLEEFNRVYNRNLENLKENFAKNLKKLYISPNNELDTKITKLINLFIYGVKNSNDKKLQDKKLQTLYLDYVKTLCFKRLPSIANILEIDKKNTISDIFKYPNKYTSTLFEERNTIINCEKSSQFEKSKLYSLDYSKLLTKRSKKYNKKNNKDRLEQEIPFSKELSKKFKDNFEKIAKYYKEKFKRIKGEVETELLKKKLLNMIDYISEGNYLQVFKTYKFINEKLTEAKLDEYSHIPKYFSFIKKNYEKFFFKKFVKLEEINDDIIKSVSAETKNTTKRLHELKRETKEQIKAKLDEFSNFGDTQ